MNKSMAIKYSLIGILIGMLFIAERFNYLSFSSPKDVAVPTVIRQSFEEEPSILEVRHLLQLAYALERYKGDHWSYPKSSNGNKAWDGIKSDFGESREDWIKGLVPQYIEELPRDPRMLDNGAQQYLYMSNGAHYKLIVYQPSNCEQVMLSYPSLIDPKRGCQAFGFWTDGAVRW